MSCVSLQRKTSKFQEKSPDLEAQLLEIGFLCENVADPDALLEPETFTTVTAYDALNRATSIRTPHNASVPASEILPAYNEASLLEKVDVKLRRATTATNFVRNIDYDAKGQRERIQYGNGTTTGYTYDDKTFRLKRLLTTRNNGADVLQDLNYTYDAAGNIAQIDDNAQQTIFFNGSAVSPSQKFEYDALYRLVKATGREHVSVNADGEPEAEGYNAAQVSPQDGSAMRNYTREWEYDSVGNILSMIHKFNGSQWTRRNAYATDSNRLNSTAVGQTTASFAYNAHGSMTSMPHLSAMDWDFAEKLCHVTRGTTEAYYNYDGNGIRTRKVVVKNGVTETRLYLGGFEIWRKTVNGVLDTERETLHVMDDQKRIAIVETLTVENGNRVAAPAPVQRYQLDNHLGSASLELDESASIISYEEYYPYGDTSYRAGRNASEVSRKRYRYTGKEKDEESSLYYHGARYYACWLGRWTAVDPIGIGDGLNVYMYVQGNPVSGVDPSGTGTDDVVWDVPDFVQTEEDFRNWVYDNAGAYIDGDVTVERTDDGRPIFNYNDADITVDQARRAEMETENRTFESYLGIAAGEEARGFYADLVVKGERQGGAWGSVEKGLGYTLGFFAALWTPETATQTAFILGTAGVGSVAPVGSMVQKGLALWGAYESSISVAEGATGTTSGLHTMDLASWARSGQYQGGHEMSAIQRGLSVVGGTVGLGMSFVGGIFQDNGATQWLQGGKSFSQYKSSHGGTKRLGYLQNETGTKVQRVSIEYHHAIIPQKMQRMYQLPNWLVNNRLNVWKLNTVQHSLIDPSRYRFIKASVKPNVSWFGKYNWFTRRF